MSILQSVQTALSNAGITIGEGQFPETAAACGKIIFAGEEKPFNFLGGKSIPVDTFKIIVRGNSYRELEQHADIIRATLKNAGCIAIGGYEDVEPKEGETFMQLSLNFKIITKN